MDRRRRAKIREMKKRQRQRRLRMVLVGVLACIVFVFGLYLFLSSSYFDIKNIEIEGNIITDAPAAAKEGGIVEGINIFSFSKSKAKEVFESYEYIKSVKIIRKLPATVKIVIEEKTPYCIVEFNGVFYHCDQEGIVLSTSQTNDSPLIPLITGLEQISTVVGNNIREMGQYKNAVVFDVLDAFYENDVLHKISEVHVENSAYYIYLRQGGILKFTSKEDFTSNLEFAMYFVNNEAENAMVELIYNNNPIYKTY